MTLPRIGILYTGEKSEMPTLSKYDTKKPLHLYTIFSSENVYSFITITRFHQRENLMLNINPNFSKKYFFIIYTFITFMLSACNSTLMSYFTHTPL